VYREDEAAARARGDALQVDLDRTEAELAATKDKLAVAEAALDAAQHPARQQRTADPWTDWFAGLILVLMVWVAIYVITR